MIKKRYLILILCIIAILSIQFVSANDNTDNMTVLGVYGEESILQAPIETQSYTDLNTIINQAGEGDEINLTYNYEYRYGNDPKTGINISKNIVINGNGATIDGKSASSLFNISSGVTVTLKNLTITHAAGIGNNGQEWYRAITSGSGTTLNIVNCTFDSNQAGVEWQYHDPFEFDGSVIYSNGNVNIQDSNFVNNIVHNYGVIFTTGTVTTKNSYFYNNKAVNHYTSGGGVIYAAYVDIIENCTFESNIANAGGSVFVFNGNTKIKNSTFDGKSAGYDQRYADNGGAIVSVYADLDIEDSTFANFTSGADGGAICILLEGNVNVVNTSIYKNSAKRGGFVFTPGTVTISDSHSIFGNGRTEYPPTEYGGLIYAQSDVVINNTDFGYNSANFAGGAVYSEGNVNFYNSKVNGSASSAKSGDGGFIYAKGNVNVENSTVASIYMKVGDQRQTYYSGAIFTEGNIVVRNSTFDGTNGNSDHSFGGAIRAKGNAEIYNSNFTNNRADKYGALHVGGTLDIYDSYFYNNLHGVAFGEGRAIVNNTRFTNNTGGQQLNGRAIGSNSTLNITNSIVEGTSGTSGRFNGTIFANGNLYVENCTIDDNHAYEATARGLALCTNSNITIINSNLDNNSFSGQDCYGCNIYAKNAYVENCTFFNSTVLLGQGKTHGVAIYAEEDIITKNSSFRDLFSRHAHEGALSGKYVEVDNCTFYNITGFGARGAAIHADVANVSDTSFYLVNSTDNIDRGGAIYANDTYAYRNNFTTCHGGDGGAIFSENYTTAIQNIFINNAAQYSGGAIFTKNGFIEYNVFIDNIGAQWSNRLGDVAFSDSKPDSLELNWWGHNRPFEDYGIVVNKTGKDRAKVNAGLQGAQGDPFLPDTWVIMDFYITNPMEPVIGQGVNLTTALERYYNNKTDTYHELNHDIAKRTVYYNATNNVTGVVEGTFSHDSAPIINRDYVMYSNNNFENHSVSSTIDYQTLYLDVTAFTMNLTKTVTNDTPKVGDIINYTITISNIDTTHYAPDTHYTEPPIMNITITDVLDDRLQLLAVNGTPCSNKTVTWYIENMHVNTTHTLILKVRVRGTGNITNIASITKVNGTELKHPYNGTNVTIYVNESTFVELNVTKSVNATNIYVGDKVEFTIAVNNTGTSNATNVKVWDILPAGFEWVSGGHYDTSTRNLTFDAVDIEAGKQVSFVFVVRAMADGKLNNTAFAHADENETIFNGTSDNITVNPDVRLNITKTVVGGVVEVYVGDSIVYEITVTNNGNSTATGVNVTEKLSDLVVVTGASDAGWNNNTKVWNVGSVESKGTKTLRLTVKVIGNGTVANAVVANSTENTTDVPANSTNVTAKPDVRLNVTKTVEGGVTEVYVGDSIVYIITVTNNGNSTATGVNVTEKLSDLVVVTAASDAGWNNVTKVWNVGSVESKGTKTLRLTVKVIGNGTVANAVVANSTENTTDVPANSTNVTAKPDVKLNITKELVTVGDIYAGDNITYEIVVTNNGLSEATGVKVTDTVKGSGEIVSCVDQYGNKYQGSVWTIPSIASGKNATLTVVVHVLANGTIANGVVATAKENDTEVTNVTPDVPVNPDVKLNITKELVTVGPIYAGDNITYVIVVSNNGVSNATNVVVTDIIKGNGVITGCVDQSGNKYQGSVWTIPSVVAGESVALTVTVYVTAEGNVANNVTAKSSENDTNVTDETPDVPVNPDVKLNINKELVTAGDIYAGDNITYVIVVSNNGISEATGVKVTDTVKGSGEIVSCIDQTGKAYSGSEWIIDSVAAGDSVTLTVVVHVLANGTIANGVVATAKENDTEVTNDTPDVPVKPDVKLNVTKELITTGDIYADDNITYVIVISNNGLSEATQVKVTDNIKGDAEITKCVDQYGKVYSGSVWIIDSVASGKNVTLTVTVHVLSNGTISNSVIVTSNENDTNISDDTPDVPVNPDVKLNITKELVTAGPIYAGDDITYVIVISNNGVSKATNVEVRDIIKGNAVITGCTDQYGNEYSGSVWIIDSIASGDSVVLTVTVHVASEGAVANNVTSKSGENDTPVSDETPEVDVLPDVKLNITKTVVGEVSEVYVGDEIVYNITVTNNGISDATDVSVSEKLSALVVVTAASDAGWNNATNVWNVGDLASGESRSLLLTVKVINNGTVANAVVGRSNENTTDVPANTTNVTANPDVRLNITKTSNVTYAKVGDNVRFTIVVTNNGLSDATDVVISDVLNNAFGYVEGGSYDAAARSVTWNIDRIEAGKSAEVYAVVSLLTDGTFANVASAHAEENTTEVTGTSDNITVRPEIVWNIIKESDVSVAYVGDLINFTITVFNNGPSNATQVSIGDILHTDFEIVDASEGYRVYDFNTIQWDIPEIRSGAGYSVWVQVRAKNNDDYVNWAHVSSDESQIATSNKTSVTVLPVVDVAIDLSVDNATPDINGIIVLNLTLKNYGPSTATQIVGNLSGDFLNGLEIISIDSEGIIFHSNDLLSYSLSDILRINEDGTFEVDYLAPGQEVSAAIKARVIRDGSIVIKGDVSENEKDSNLSNNHDEVTLKVYSLVDLTVKKSVNETNPTVGDAIEYTITVVNKGPSNATDVVVNEKLPDGVVYISDNSNGKYDPATGVWNVGELLSNETATLTVKVTVSKVGNITNLVDVNSTQDNTNPDGAKDNVTINVKDLDKVDIKVTKTVNNTRPYIGDLVVYTITISNIGNRTATGVVVYEDLIDGLRFVSDDSNGQYNFNWGVWNIGVLEPGETRVLNIVVQVTKLGEISNFVIVDCNQEFVNVTSTYDNVTIVVVEHPEPEDNDTVAHHSSGARLKEAGNPLMMLLVVLLSAAVCAIRRKQ
ncbi:hypothetical protein [uncultured Methanobrevibacter sp.]|uniref:hypothetical protein n=1 Tax=uncultured Methanobrevibacter sp. TaxID=253161 RepID=UPI0025E7A84A|nr:hypothetical protein [uncultured Methanobrevibacter sp.]